MLSLRHTHTLWFCHLAVVTACVCSDARQPHLCLLSALRAARRCEMEMRVNSVTLRTKRSGAASVSERLDTAPRSRRSFFSQTAVVTAAKTPRATQKVDDVRPRPRCSLRSRRRPNGMSHASEAEAAPSLNTKFNPDVRLIVCDTEPETGAAVAPCWW